MQGNIYEATKQRLSVEGTVTPKVEMCGGGFGCYSD